MRCPVCRAESNVGPSCRRCRADLSLLFQLEDQRAVLLQQAQTQAARGNWPELIRLAKEIRKLREDNDAAQLEAIGWLMEGNFQKAWEKYPG